MSTGHNVILDTSALIDFEELDGKEVAAHAGCNYAELAPGITSITLRLRRRRPDSCWPVTRCSELASLRTLLACWAVRFSWCSPSSHGHSMKVMTLVRPDTGLRRLH